MSSRPTSPTSSSTSTATCDPTSLLTPPSPSTPPWLTTTHLSPHRYTNTSTTLLPCILSDSFTSPIFCLFPLIFLVLPLFSPYLVTVSLIPYPMVEVHFVVCMVELNGCGCGKISEELSSGCRRVSEEVSCAQLESVG